MQKIRTFDKIVTLSDLESIKRIAVSAHLSIACATGCFDILHGGHVRFLEKARASAEMLIVGVVHDAAYRILKGREPVVHQDDRIYTVSRLVCTDHAVFFGEEEELILRLQPDIVVISPTSPSERIADKQRLAERCHAQRDQGLPELDTAYWRVLACKYPYLDGNLMITPMRHVEHTDDLTAEEWADFPAVLKRCLDALFKIFKTRSFNLGFNVGPDSGRSIPHLHWMLLPRTSGKRQYPVFEAINDFVIISMDYKTLIKKIRAGAKKKQKRAR